MLDVINRQADMSFIKRSLRRKETEYELEKCHLLLTSVWTLLNVRNRDTFRDMAALTRAVHRDHSQCLRFRRSLPSNASSTRWKSELQNGGVQRIPPPSHRLLEPVWSPQTPSWTRSSHPSIYRSVSRGTGSYEVDAAGTISHG